MAFFKRAWYDIRMNRRNYQNELDRIIAEGGRPRLLLHSCCGPCSTAVLEYLTAHFDVTLLWFNPNLYPKEEFELRYRTQIEVIEKLGYKESVHVICEEWQSKRYFDAVKGFEDEPEGGRRCHECFRLRLRECARVAAEQGFDYFCSTLTVSRHKNAVVINAIGEDEAKLAAAVWLPSDFKKRDGENRSVELSEKLGIYRQVYCGCKFSLLRRAEGKHPARDGKDG